MINFSLNTEPIIKRLVNNPNVPAFAQADILNLAVEIGRLNNALRQLTEKNSEYKYLQAKLGKANELSDQAYNDLSSYRQRADALERALYIAGGRQYDCEMCLNRDNKEVDCLESCNQYWRFDVDKYS